MSLADAPVFRGVSVMCEEGGWSVRKATLLYLCILKIYILVQQLLLRFYVHFYNDHCVLFVFFVTFL